MAITRFEDAPSTNTPINSANLNGNFDELGVKVGTSVDSNYRTNILYSKNLLNPIDFSSRNTPNLVRNDGTFYNTSATDTRGWSYDNSDFKLILTPGTYTFQFFTTNTGSYTPQVRLYYTSDTYTDIPLDASGNGTKTITITQTETRGLMFKIWDREFKIQIVKGSEPLNYENYVIPSVSVEDDIIYDKGIILYNKPRGDNGNITLSDNASYYNLIAIDYFVSSYARVERKYIPNPQNKTCYLSMITPDPAGRIYINAKSVTIQGTAINITDNTRYSNTFINGNTITQSNSNEIFITKVIGYK